MHFTMLQQWENRRNIRTPGIKWNSKITAGPTSALYTSIDYAAKTGLSCPVPTRWKRDRALEKCHYAAMHMLFLGHVKSNMELFSKWLTVNDLLTKFGRQVNPMLIFIRDMRMKRFSALPFSTSIWGTGPWVSENYVFWQRTWKYFFGYPVIMDNQKLHANALQLQLNVAKRFIASSHACISAIMSPSTEGSGRMRALIPIYLDTMVEMDNMIRSALSDKKKKQEVSAKIKGNQKGDNTGRKKQSGNATYVKSNSLGLLAVADAHDYFGSAAMNWEGGEEGERKIQQVKPQLAIKRKTAAWQKLAMEKIYTNDSVDWLLDRLPPPKTPISSRETGKHHNYKGRVEALNAIIGSGALSIYEIHGELCLLYKPVGEEDNTRSSFSFLKISMDDTAGKYHFGCWYAPLVPIMSKEKPEIVHVSVLQEIITKNILALPLLESNDLADYGYTRTTLFYLISDDWDERLCGGIFIKSHITETLFASWAE
jgi:hypothetical protein